MSAADEARAAFQRAEARMQDAEVVWRKSGLKEDFEKYQRELLLWDGYRVVWLSLWREELGGGTDGSF